jgi:hypothetical protein
MNASNYRQEIASLGFFVTSTGGGCTAWCKQFADGRHVLITDGDLGDDLASAELIEVGAYTADSEMISDDYWCGDFGGLPAAIERFSALCA